MKYNVYRKSNSNVGGYMKKNLKKILGKIPGSKLVMFMTILIFIVFILYGVSGLFFILPDGKVKMGIADFFCRYYSITRGLSILSVFLTGVFMIHFWVVPQYESNGVLGSWYSGNLKVVKPAYVSEWFNTFIPQYLVDGSKVGIVSPSANRGVHELSIFDGLRSLYEVSFVASDIAEIPDHVGSKDYETSKFHYVPCKNAIDVKTTINEYGLETVNIIFDMKGALWHSSLNPSFKTHDIIDVYKSILSDDGIIIIDAFKTSTIKVWLSHFIPFSHMSEESTYYRLRRSRKVRKLMDHGFEKTLHHLPSEPNKPFIVLKPVK